MTDPHATHLAPALRAAAADRGRADPGLLDAAAHRLDVLDGLVTRLMLDLAVETGQPLASVATRYGQEA